MANDMQHATAPATYFPLTLRGLIAYGQVAADPSQGAATNHMRYLIEQMVPHLKRLDEIESSTPAAPGEIDVTTHSEQQGFTAADMADQYATAFERGRESVLAEQAAAAQEASAATRC